MSKDSAVCIFAYGSNLCTNRIRARVSTAQRVTIGYVLHRRFRFHKRSIDGSAKADAAWSASVSDRVWGVVYRLHPSQKPQLDEHEFLGTGYDQKRVQVVHERGVLPAWMYVARAEAIDASLLPYTWYQDLIVSGAREHRLPSAYVDHLKRFESVVDLDTKRHLLHGRLLVETKRDETKRDERHQL